MTRNKMTCLIDDLYIHCTTTTWKEKYKTKRKTNKGYMKGSENIDIQWD